MQQSLTTVWSLPRSLSRRNPSRCSARRAASRRAGRAGLLAGGACLCLQSAAAQDALADALFADPNCTQSARWSAWRDLLLRAPSDMVRIRRGQDILAELAQEGGGDALAAMVTPEDPCMLGAASLMFLRVLAEWHSGLFLPALRSFAILHDEFLTNMHPHFYDMSAWPVVDADVRPMKGELLYNIRKFRTIAAEREKEPGPLSEDALEHENLDVFATHLREQLAQRTLRDGARGARRDRAAPAPWIDASEGELLPSWEALPEAALATASIRPSVDSETAPPLRVFVYDEASVPALGTLCQGPAFCHNRQWGMDVGFHDFFSVSPIRTLDPGEADFFFVPAYAVCLQTAGILEFDEVGRSFATLVAELPYFARTAGRDHIFAIHYVNLFAGWRELAPLSVFLTPETEVGWEQSRDDHAVDLAVHPAFDSRKDLAVPPFMRLSHVLELHRAARPLGERPLLAAFAGKLWADVHEAHDVRSRVKKNLGDKPGVAIVTSDSVAGLLAPAAMARLMGDSTFCLVPRGRATWSVRFFETLWSGCVPVILSDHYEVPFEALFDVSEFAIKWPVDRIDDSLYDYLMGLSSAVVEAYVEGARRVRCWFLYPPPEVSWLGGGVSKKELAEVEKELCPNLSSSRNAFQGVAELLGRKRRRSKTAMGTAFYWPDPETSPITLRHTDADMRSIMPN